MCARVCPYVGTCFTGCMCWLESRLWESVLSCYQMGLRAWNLGCRFDSRWLFLLSHPPRLPPFSFIIILPRDDQQIIFTIFSVLLAQSHTAGLSTRLGVAIACSPLSLSRAPVSDSTAIPLVPSRWALRLLYLIMFYPQRKHIS